MTNPNESTYPENVSAYCTPDDPKQGLTKREYFAAMALQGMLANTETDYRSCIKVAVMAADDLIIELNNTNPNEH